MTLHSSDPPTIRVVRGPRGPSGGVPDGSTSADERWMGFRSGLATRVRVWWSAHPTRWGLLGVAIGVVSFALFASWVWTQRYSAFETYAYDLGNYNQGFYTTLSDHLLFYYTPDLPSGTTSLLAAHFSPILFPLLPLYAIYPAPPSLLAIQAIALALGAVPVYLLAKLYLKSDAWAIFLSGFYLLTPITLGAGWYDFHPEAFLPVCMLTALYFFARHRLWPFLAAWLLTLCVIETAAPLLMLFAAAVIFGALWKHYRHGDSSAVPELRFAVLGLAVAGAWIGLSYLVISSISASAGTFGSAYAGNWSILGATSILDVVPHAILHPASAWNALTYEGWIKLSYVLLLFGCFAFLPLWGQKRYLAMVAGWLVLALLSNHRGYYVFGDQYLGYVLAPLMAGTITGITRILASRRWPALRRWRVPAAVGGLVAAVAVSALLVSPLLPANTLSFGIPHGIPTITTHDQLLHELIAEVPSQAAILTTPAVFPEVSNRLTAYVDPVSSFFAGNLTFQEALDRYINESRYVLVDYTVDYDNSVVMERYANLTGFGLVAGVDGAYLFERGWSGPPSWWIPFELTVTPSQLTVLSGTISNGVLIHSPSASANVQIWDGPGTQSLPPGDYRITASIRYAVPAPGTAFRLILEQQQITLVEELRPLPGGKDYKFLFDTEPVNVTTISTADLNVSAPSLGFANVTATGLWANPGFLRAPGYAIVAGTGIDLYSLSIVQTTATWSAGLG